MAIEIARYQFHPWARKGIANNITEGDDLGAGTSTTIERAPLAIGVSLNGTAQTKNFLLVGPGDIIGVNNSMVVRTEPVNWVTDFEPNYLAFIEFYDEDFAWRYSPAAPAGNRLRPWIFLLVLKEDEFERTAQRVPLPSVKISGTAVFPPAAETWLWAHVHSNADIPDSELSDYEKFLLSLNTTTTNDPDQLYCRLMSPRKLEPKTAYVAFLIPAFETGRLAGLGQPTDTTHAQQASWDDTGARGEMPVYYEWSFKTGVDEDFESLVRLLEPRVMDPKVGIRDMDCHAPGFVKADSSGELPGTSPPIIGLEGALRSPDTVSTTFPDPPASTSFQQELQKIVNLPFEILGTDTSGDPVISIPLYGGNHAKTSATDVVKLDITRQDWVDDLNKDPRTRVAAGFGTRVVQENQDYFMRKAWDQVTNVLAANKKIKQAVFTMNVAARYTAKTFSALAPNNLLAMSKPVLSRVMGSPTTILQQVRNSNIPVAAFSGTFRRYLRPRGPVMRKLNAATPLIFDGLINDIGAGKVTAAPPRSTPAGIPDTSTIAGQISSATMPAWLTWLIQHALLVLIILLILLAAVGFATGAWLVVGIIAVAAAIAAARARTVVVRDTAAATALTDPRAEASALASIPPQPHFTLALSDETTTPPATSTPAGADSVEGGNFRKALTDFSKRMTINVPQEAVVPLNLPQTYQKVSAAISPLTAFPYQLYYTIKFPGYINTTDPASIFEAMAYPDFEEPMYKELVDISGELLLPNLKLVPANTISLVKTNQEFIESYLVGLNHEMGRELLWREYPTDQRGSYFRQFWDVKGIIRPDAGKTDAELTEEYKDIDPIHTWGRPTLLGSHNKRSTAAGQDKAVLLMRGDLLKRYPNTVIFAQKAIPKNNSTDTVIDQDLSTAEFATEVRFPLYKAGLPPDIKVFGFDLTIKQASGDDLTPGFDDNLGWFFVIQEVPGEPRFGMDIHYDPGTDGISWDDLAWDLLPDGTQFIKGNVLPNITVADKSRWGSDSANMAYVLFQKPSMVAVHAKEMLDGLST